MSPLNARKEDSHNYIFQRINGRNMEDDNTQQFQICDSVRKIIRGNIFTKGYVQKFSDEIFNVVDVKFDKTYIYYLNSNDSGKSWFYESELSKA